MKEITPFTVSVPFKGSRTYLQSADVYAELLNQLASQIPLSACSETRLIFREFTASELKVTQTLPPAAASPNATFSCSVGDKKLKLYISETGIDILERRPYSEEEIAAKCKIDQNYISVSLVTDELNETFGLVELLVGMNKAMHLSVFSDNKGKWLFTEINSFRAIYDQKPDSIEIRLEKNLGLKLTKSKIFFDGNEIGYICFSLQPLLD